MRSLLRPHFFRFVCYGRRQQQVDDDDDDDIVVAHGDDDDDISWLFRRIFVLFISSQGFVVHSRDGKVKNTIAAEKAECFRSIEGIARSHTTS